MPLMVIPTDVSDFHRSDPKSQPARNSATATPQPLAPSSRASPSRQPALDLRRLEPVDLDDLRARGVSPNHANRATRHLEGFRKELAERLVRAPTLGRSRYARAPAVSVSSHQLGPARAGRDRHRDPRHSVPLPAVHAGLWPAITRRQSPPSPLPRLQALAADECGLLLGARDPEFHQRHWKGH
jgi:hypothetical protein